VKAIFIVPLTADPSGFLSKIAQVPVPGVTASGVKPAPVAVPLPTDTLTMELELMYELVRVIRYVAAAAVVKASVVMTPVWALTVAAPAVEVAVPGTTSTDVNSVVSIDIIFMYYSWAGKGGD